MFDTRQESIVRLCQSIIATRYKKPHRIGMYMMSAHALTLDWMPIITQKVAHLPENEERQLQKQFVDALHEHQGVRELADQLVVVIRVLQREDFTLPPVYFAWLSATILLYMVLATIAKKAFVWKYGELL